MPGRGRARLRSEPRGSVSDDLASATALELSQMIRTKRVSPVEVVTAALVRLERLEPSLNAFVTVTPDLALEGARRAEATLMAGGDPPPLLGLPVSVKDLIAVKDVRATFGSRKIGRASCRERVEISVVAV